MNKLIIAGIGPGNVENMTIGVDKALREADVILGYGVYVDLVKNRYPEKEFITTPMTKEKERCVKALELAAEGRNTVLICSGDSGIYGMAGLVYELRGGSVSPEIMVLPGITAASGGAALLGAPLTHDFAVISLSDRLTKWETIAERLTYAAMADLSILLYNPSSNSRPDHLRRACEILLQFLPGNRLCGIARMIGREGESTRLLSLAELKEAETDMFCTVFIGNSMSRRIGDRMVTPRGYHDIP